MTPFYAEKRRCETLVREQNHDMQICILENRNGYRMHIPVMSRILSPKNVIAYFPVTLPLMPCKESVGQAQDRHAQEPEKHAQITVVIEAQAFNKQLQGDADHDA